MTESPICVGILSAGAMGSALGRAWRDSGARVLTTLAGRSPRTSKLAADAGLELLADLDEVLAAAQIVISVVPPDRALEMAADIAAAAARVGARPLVADLNATAPQTVLAVADVLNGSGLDLVDGSISGSPPRPGATTRVYLSGARASEIAALGGDGIDARIIGDQLGAASAVKMCTASVFKGFTGLLTQAMLTAHAHGVDELVVDDLSRQFPDHIDRLPAMLSLAASNAWRFVGEMEQISETQAGAGARPELFAAMAQVWTMVSQSELGQAAPEDAPPTALADVLDKLGRKA